MEELLEQLAAARGVFERWMKWEPEENGWMTYCNFEVRHGAWERARERTWKRGKEEDKDKATKRVGVTERLRDGERERD